MQPILEALRAAGAEQTPTHFEVMTAIAFGYFARHDVDVAILEVGLGGRLDATNVVEQAVSVFTPIDVDHAEVLGAEPVAIAKEKAGIIKPHQVVITAPQHDAVAAVLRVNCDAHAVPLYTCGEDLTVRIASHTVEGLQVSVTALRGIYESLDVPLMGRHQAENAAVAVAALEALSSAGVPAGIVERGLAQVEWPGRLEIVNDAPLVLLDGAHNPHAAGALAATLRELFSGRRIHLLIGMSSDKAVEAVAAQLGSLAHGATCTRSTHPRALDPSVLARRLAPFVPDVHVMSDAADAYTYLLNALPPTDVIVVTGSLFLVGELHARLRRGNGRARRAAAVEAAA